MEVIDTGELARRWMLPESWIRSKTKASRCAPAKQIPHVQFGRYVRFEWGSPALETWLAQWREGKQ